MEYRFGIKSSSSEDIYTVTFKFDNDLTSINCNCQAGAVKMLCKHRLNLLDGDITKLAEPSDFQILTEIINKIDKTKVADLYTD